MKIIFVCFIILLCLIAACSESYIVNMKEKTNYSEGRELFVSKCNSCHKLSSPNEFTSAEWDSILVPMKKKAKLNTEQRNEIYNWILEIKKNYRNSQVSN